MKKYSYFLFGLLACLGSSCHQANNPLNEKAAPIILGDSSTIVTERDSAFLSDDVADMDPQAGNPQEINMEPEASQDTQAQANPQTVPEPAQKPVNGFQIDFGKGVTAVYTGIATTTFGKQDPINNAGVSYKITSGDLTKSQIVVSGLKNIRVRQRYQTELKLVYQRQELNLSSLGSYLSGWQNLNASNGTIFQISEINQPAFKSISNATLRDAILRSTRSRRGRATAQANTWLQRIKTTKSALDAPCVVTINNVQWQITGTDNSGKSFIKNIRMDL